jgi:prevent-host-death family protein
MTKQVNVHEAKTHLSRLLELAHQGEEVVIAKGGTPYARLVALEEPRVRALGFLDVHLPDEYLLPLEDADQVT